MTRPPGSADGPRRALRELTKDGAAFPALRAAFQRPGGRKRVAALAAAVVLAVAAGAAAALWPASDSDSYFPLSPGRSWIYAQHINIHGGPDEDFRSVSVNLSRETVDGERTTPRLFNDGRTLYYGREADGIRAVAFRQGADNPHAAAPGQFLLKFPLVPGTKWRSPAHTTILVQRIVYNRQIPIAIPVDVDYSVVSVDEDVTVPAGRFHHCVHIKGEAHTMVNAIDNVQMLPVSVEVENWYAPGVGLVKSIRTEAAGAERTGNAHMVMVLTAFR